MLIFYLLTSFYVIYCFEKNGGGRTSFYGGPSFRRTFSGTIVHKTPYTEDRHVALTAPSAVNFT